MPINPLEVENEIRDKFNKFTETYSDYLDKNYSFAELMIIFYTFDGITIEEYNPQQTFDLLEKINELDLKIFATKIPRKGMISVITQLERM